MEDARIEVAYELRYRGQAFELPVAGDETPDPDEVIEAFASEHERRYGFRDDAGQVELVAIAVALIEPEPEPSPRAAADTGLERGSRRVRFAGGWHESSVLRGDPPAGTRFEGPAVLELPETTLVLPPGWSAEVDAHGTVAAERTR
jgi:N-methylhydantoinase A